MSKPTDKPPGMALPAGVSQIPLTDRGYTMPDFSEAGKEPFIIGSTVYHMEFNGTLHEFEVVPAMLTPEDRGKGHNCALVHKESKDRANFNHQMFSTTKAGAIEAALVDIEEMRENIRNQLGGIETAMEYMRQQLKVVLKEEGKPTVADLHAPKLKT